MSKYCRATFEGYLGAPGEIIMRMPKARAEVEIYRATSQTWRVRTVGSGADHKGIAGPPEFCMSSIRARFTSQIESWRWVDSSGQEVESPIDDENARHVVGGRAGDNLDAKHRRTLCGRVVHMSRVTTDASGSSCDVCRGIRVENAGIRK